MKKIFFSFLRTTRCWTLTEKTDDLTKIIVQTNCETYDGILPHPCKMNYVNMRNKYTIMRLMSNVHISPWRGDMGHLPCRGKEYATLETINISF